MRTFFLAVSICAVMSGGALANSTPTTLEGLPVIVDADTVKLSGEKIRFRAIDAPETKQVCQDADGADYLCGVAATEALKQKIGDNTIRCEIEGRGTYGRALGECYQGEVNLSQWLVLNGHALAYRRYSTRYVQEEDEARSAKRGMWAGTFEKPWKWRKKNR